MTAMASPQDVVIELLFGRWRSQILHAGVRLGIFDALGGSPRSSDDVARDLGLDAGMTYRLMRALGSLELLREGESRLFELAETGRLLRADHPQSLRGVVLLEEGPTHYALWTHLTDMVRDGEQNAFVREFGRMAFDHAALDSDYRAVFNDAMSSYSAAQTAWVLESLGDCDLSGVSHLCDVAGGHGHLLCSLLAEHPHMTGTVLELPNVIEDVRLLWATRMGVGDRCRYVGGDMFEEVPAADAYIMKMILHDWNDHECVQILSNLRRSTSGDGRLLIAEHFVPGPDVPHFSKLFDIHMICWGTGRERTVDEYAALMERAGWGYRRTWTTPAGPIGVVEGAAA